MTSLEESEAQGGGQGNPRGLPPRRGKTKERAPRRDSLLLDARHPQPTLCARKLLLRTLKPLDPFSGDGSRVDRNAWLCEVSLRSGCCQADRESHINATRQELLISNSPCSRKRAPHPRKRTSIYEALREENVSPPRKRCREPDDEAQNDPTERTRSGPLPRT